MFKTQKKTLFFALFLITILFSACSSSGGGDSNGGDADELAKGSEWDKMEWDRGQWKWFFHILTI